MPNVPGRYRAWGPWPPAPTAAKRKPAAPDDWARTQAERVVSAQVASIEAERAAYLDELNRQAEIERERGKALAAELRSLNFPAAIQGIYSTAASDLAGLAGGFAGSTRNIAAADAAEQASYLSGTGQEGAVRNEGVGMGDVIYGLEGFIPGRSLGETGAALAAHAALEPSFAAQLGLVEAGRVKSEGQRALSEFARAIAEARSQRPILAMELRQQREELAREGEDAQRDWYLKLAALEISRGNEARANEYLRLAGQREFRQEQKSRGLDVDGKPLPGYRVNTRTGRVEKIPKAGESPFEVDRRRVNSLQSRTVSLVKARFFDEDGKPTTSLGDAAGQLWNLYRQQMATERGREYLKNWIVNLLTALGLPKVYRGSAAPTVDFGALLR